jgi:DNA-binding NtrC family response regulator
MLYDFPSPDGETMKKRILLVDDEKNILKVMSASLRKEGYEVETARSGEEAIGKIGTNRYSLIITDYKLPGINGLGLLQELKGKDPDLPIIILTAYGTIEKAVEAMKKGASNYLTKPLNLDELTLVTRDAIERHALIEENKALRQRLLDKYSFDNIIGKCPAMEEVFRMIRMVSRSNANILIIGGSGTGKELVARAIHFASERKGFPFVPVDCAAIPEGLLENEIFGHEKGAYTGAHDKRIGLIEQAHGGAIFLDEVGELSLNLQKKLLRVLQEREFQRLGGKERVKVDIRVIAATNRDLEEDVKEGRFREDLFYRLNVVSIPIPPLRERRDDIPLLSEYFLRKYNEENKKDIRSFDPCVMDLFMNYDWPGNVRELENTVERAVVLCNFERIVLDNIPSNIINSAGKKWPIFEIPSECLNLIEIEKRVVQKALDEVGWNQSKASAILGISRKQLRTKMKHLGLVECHTGK